MTTRIKILGHGAMDPKVDALLADRFEILRADAAGMPAIFAQAGEIRGLITAGRLPTDAALIARLPKLEIIGNFGVGYDSVDVAAAAARGIVVTHTPDVLNDEMGDFTIGLLLATIRRLPQADRYIRTHRWGPDRNFPLGQSWRDRRIGIAGRGRIGATIARRLEGFDLPLAAFVRRPRPDLGHMQLHDTLLALAQAVDTLIVVLPGGSATRNVVDAAVLRALGPNGILINVARGFVVDEAALIAALGDGTILAAGLDVFAQEPHVPDALKEMDNVVLLPHIGTATLHTRALMGRLLVDNIHSWFDGAGALTPVPETPQPTVATR